MAEKVRDLRSALALLEQMPNQLIETEVEVDPMAELAGVFRQVRCSMQWGAIAVVRIFPTTISMVKYIV